MAVTRASKIEELQELEAAFTKTESAVLVDFRGLKVPEVTELRRQVRAARGRAAGPDECSDGGREEEIGSGRLAGPSTATESSKSTLTSGPSEAKGWQALGVGPQRKLQ